MESIRGTTPQDIGKLNTILLKLQTKIYSKLGIKDFDYDTQKKISARLLPINGVGNFDSSVPFNFYFYIPKDKYNVIGSSFSFLGGRYRTDVGTTLESGSFNASGYTTSNGGGNIMTEPGNPVVEHRHSVVVSSHTHTANVTMPSHIHGITKEISVETSDPTSITIRLNGTTITTMSRTTLQKDNIDVKDLIVPGWNIVSCSATTLARITFYGIIELSAK